jgi:hypothetical protein
MPEIAAFVGQLRAAFGDCLDEAVTRGKSSEPTFYARENGRTVGTPPADHHNAWKASRTFAIVTIATDVTEVASEPRLDVVSA